MDADGDPPPPNPSFSSSAPPSSSILDESYTAQRALFASAAGRTPFNLPAPMAGRGSLSPCKQDEEMAGLGHGGRGTGRGSTGKGRGVRGRGLKGGSRGRGGNGGGRARGGQDGGVLNSYGREHGGDDEDFAQFNRNPNFIPTIPKRYNKYAVPPSASDGSTFEANVPTIDKFRNELATSLSLAWN